MAELSFAERVDDAILAAAAKLARLRGSTLRGAISDFRASALELADVDPDAIWRLRVDRCNALLFREDDELRKLARSALERER